jgi:hypothetical protein
MVVEAAAQDDSIFANLHCPNFPPRRKGEKNDDGT